jgi:hypothetical protein
MSCNSVRQRLLASERPDQPAAEEARHLLGCQGCRAWLRRLARLEQLLPLAPVPPTAGPPAALLEMLQASPARPLVRAPANLTPSALPRREGGRQKLALALALAASLTLFALAWWAWPHVQPPTGIPREPYRRLVAARLAPARTDKDRVNVLANLADDFLAEAQKRPAEPAEVERLAVQFGWLVEEDLPRQAKQVSLTARHAALMPIAARLGRVQKEANTLAARWQKNHAASAASLLRIAKAAGEAESRLKRLARVT